MRLYQRDWLTADLLAGITAGAVVIPQAMGYATVAGLPVQMGLYTCMVPMVVYALLGGARRLSLSTTSTIVALTGVGLVANLGTDAPQSEMASTAITLTLMVGVAVLLFWVLRLGWIVDAISDTVLIGLKIGVGFTILASQLPDLLGIESAGEGFFGNVTFALTNLDDANPITVLISAVTIGGLLALKQWAPRIPGPLLALAGGILLVAIFNVDQSGVILIPAVPSGLPGVVVPPLDHVPGLIPYALAIGLLAYMETIAVGRSTRQPTDPPIVNNQEAFAAGAASVAGAFFQAVPAAGGFSQTVVNADAGARTQLSELVTAGLAVGVALFLAPVLSDLPKATLASIVTVAVLGLISFFDLGRVARVDRVELIVALVTAVVALVTNLLFAVVAGVVLTLYLVLRRLNHPVILELQRPPGGAALEPARPGDVPVPGMLVIRIEGGLYTMNIRGVQAEIYRRVDEADPPPEVVLLDVGGTADTSVTVLDVMAESDQQLASSGTTLWVAQLPTRAIEKARHLAAWSSWMSSGRVFTTVEEAVETFEARW